MAAASVADLREFLLRRGFSEADADFIAALADDLRDSAGEQVLDRVEERMTHFEAIFRERLNGHEAANRHEFREVLSTIREVVANAQIENEKRFSELAERISALEADLAEFKGEVRGEIAGLKGEIAGLKSEIEGLKSEIAGLRSEMEGMRKELRGWVSQSMIRLAVFQTGLVGVVFAILGALGVLG